MRYTKVPTYRLQAQQDMQSICDLLEQLGDHFNAASLMAKMGKAILREMDRVSETISECRQRGKQRDISERAPNPLQERFVLHKMLHPRDQGETKTRMDYCFGFVNWHADSTQQATNKRHDNATHTVNLDRDYPSYLSPDIDNFHYAEMSNIDIFSMFDPNFGLERVDNLFQNNLDLSMRMYLPSNAQDRTNL